MITTRPNTSLLRPVTTDVSRGRNDELDCNRVNDHEDSELPTIEKTESTSTRQVILETRVTPPAPDSWSDNGDLWPGRSKIQEVTQGVCITNFFGSKKLPLLEAHKITHVIICANELPEAFPLHFQYLKLKGFTDNTGTNLKEQLDIALPWIGGAVKEDGRVLLHCATGSSRSGAVIVAYLMRYQKLSLKDALVIARRERPIIKPNPGFMKQLEAFNA